MAGSITIGDRIPEFFDCSVAYAFKVTAAAAAANVATLTHSTGVVVKTTGLPVVLDGTGADWQGQALPVTTASLILMVAVVAGATNPANGRTIQ